ncbi:MAG TPA: type IV secretory system conjugative DNA transfer family protein [Gemmataceae bacterium]|nr:type IV secretory system conjugative DNA transfer family protein [Gemmataceae bacterium]
MKRVPVHEVRFENAARADGDGVLLGWEAQPRPLFGFAAGADVTGRRRPIDYHGDAHLLTVAPTGSGKGRGSIIPNLLTYPGPVVVFDPKGENYLVTARRRRALGQRVVRLDPFGVVDDDGDGFNPLDVFDLPGADPECDAQMLAELLSTGNRGVKDPFWDLNACGLHSGLIAHVATGKPRPERHFNEVRKYLMADDAVYSMAVLLDTAGKSMNRMAHDEIAAFLQMSERDTRPGVLATANSYIKPFLSERVVKALQASSFDLNDVVRGRPLSIYLILPPDKLHSHRGLLKLWVGTLLRAITCRRHIPPRRTLFVLDECGQLGPFPLLETVITLCRGYGVQCWTFWQDLAQIQASFPTGWKTIINNSGVVQVFGINNREMATQWGEYLRHGAEELLALRAEEQVLQVRGREEMKSLRLDYLGDPLFAALFDRNRFFAGAGAAEELAGGMGDRNR